MIALDDVDERKLQIKMRKIELFAKGLNEEMLVYLIQAANYYLIKKMEKNQ